MFGNMLVIHQLNPTGMFSYGLSKNINLLNRGLVHLVGVNDDKGGDSNGAGKSSLFNAICELLFQENPTGEKGDSVINSVWDKGFAGRIMITNWQGIHYRITYCRKWKDRLYPADNDNNVEYVGTGLFLDRYEDKMWKDCRGAGMPETHLKILEIVGMTYKQFVSIAYMTHRVGSQFLRGSNKERIDILAGITGIEEWDVILDKCRSKKRILNTQIEGLNRQASFKQGSVQTLVNQLEKYKGFDWETYTTNLQDELSNAQIDHGTVREEIARVSSEIEELTRVRDKSYNAQKLENINIQIQDLNKKLRKLEIELSRAFYQTEDPNLSQKYQEVTSSLGQAQGELRAVRGNAGSILELTQCPTCGSKITKAKKDKISKKIKELESRILELESSRTNIQQISNEFYTNQRLQDQKVKEKARLEIDQVREQIQSKMNEGQREQVVYIEYNKKIQIQKNILINFQAEDSRLQNIENQIKTKIEQANASISYIQVLEKEIGDYGAEVKSIEKDIAKVEGQLDVYLWLISNIPYIKLHKMARAMSEISEMCNRYFDEMGDTIRINISSFEEKVSKKHAADIKDLMKSEVKVEIIDGSKNISPKLYSDGEISKVSLAVIRALHELARKSGQGCNLMLMDEVFSFVDGDNSQRIAQSLSSFLSKGTVFLTDNSGSVKNLINFDKVWVARKKNGQTLLEVDQ